MEMRHTPTTGIAALARSRRTRPSRHAATAALLVAGTALLAARIPAEAQPAPSFRATCADLRASIAALRHDGERLVTIQVVGPLTDVRSDGVLAYMFMCQAPHPRVLCVTYQTNGRTAGDVAVLTGAFSQRGPDHILLDPCLHQPPEEAPAR